MSVGLVIVSHSQKLAEGVAELAGQMANGSVVIAPAGGTADGSLGTSVEKVLQALARADSGDGALILLDLGSAGMVVEMALEAISPEQRVRVQVSSAPLVEGAVLAAVEASLGRPLNEVAKTARQAPELNKLPSERERIMVKAQTTVTLRNKMGLHGRPAAKFVQTAGRFSSAITVQHGERAGDAKRMLEVLKVSASGGAEITISAEGDDAEAALAALTALIVEKFGEAE